MIAALRVVRRQQPHELIFAVPVAPPDRLEPIRERCDRLICLATPADFWAVGQFYEEFEQVEDGPPHYKKGITEDISRGLK